MILVLTCGKSFISLGSCPTAQALDSGRGACHREEVNICQELLHFLKIGAPIFGPTEVYSYIINYTPSTNWKILKNYEKLFFWSTAILQSVIKKHCKKQSRRIPSKTIRTYLIFGQVFLKPGVKLIWHDGAACACAANKKASNPLGKCLLHSCALRPLSDQ